MFRFESLEIWDLAIDYGVEIFNVCKTLPKNEIFSLIPQLKRAVISISNNIAEGSGAQTAKGFKVFLNYSIKSALETASLILLTDKLGYLDKGLKKRLYEKAEKIIRKIRSFKKTLS